MSTDDDKTIIISNDEKILIILYLYWQKYLGTPEMGLDSLRKIFNSEPISSKELELKYLLHDELGKLKEKGWIIQNLTSTGDAGLISLTATGRKVALQLPNEKKQRIVSLIKSISKQKIKSSSPVSLEELGEHHLDLKPFIERYDELYLIKSTFKHNINHLIILCGQPRVGKSVMLKFLQKKLESVYIPIIINLQGFEIDRFNKLDNFILALTQKTSEVLPANIKSNQPKLTSLQSDNASLKDTFFRYWVALSNNNQNKRPLVMIDEIEYLLDIRQDTLDLEIIYFLEQFVLNKDYGYFVITASERFLNHQTKDLFKSLALNAKYIPIFYYKQAVSKAVFLTLQDHFEHVNVALIDVLINDCVALCDGHPSLLDKLYKLLEKFFRDNKDEPTIAKARAVIMTDFSEQSKDVLTDLDNHLSIEEWAVCEFIYTKIQQRIYDTQQELTLPTFLKLMATYFNQAITINTLQAGIQKLEIRGWVMTTTSGKQFNLGVFLLGIIQGLIQRNNKKVKK